MQKTVITVNGKPEIVRTARDFQDLISKHMGFDAMEWFREFADDYEDLENAFDELEKDHEKLQDEFDELEERVGDDE